MKLIATDSGQTLNTVLMEEIRPRAGIYMPDFVMAIAKRYSFAKAPVDLFEAAQNGYKFAMGKISVDGEIAEIKQLDIYRDGIIAMSLNTSLSDAIIDDLIAWASKEFDLNEPIAEMVRTHTSTVVVEFDHSINSAVKHFTRISTLLTQAYVTEPNGYPGPLGVFRLAFMADPKISATLSPTQFLIEGRALTPADQHRYYSVAPLPTERHLALLEKIETVWRD